MTQRAVRDTTPRCPACGWAGKTTTAGLARKSMDRHRCERHGALAESAARGRARAAAIDRTPRPCVHKRADHVHGTYAAYVLDRCRCHPCAKANRDYEKRRTRAQAYGRWDGLVPAGAARLHVLHLMRAGIGLKRVAALSGVPQGTLWKLVYGKRRPDGTRVPSRRVRPNTAARLLAVQPCLDLLGATVAVDGTGTRRRLQALVALGWPIVELGRRLHLTNIHRTIHGRDVRAGTARAVRDLYDQMWDQVPPRSAGATRARAYAATRGWPPPLAWDDDTIDDPHARPDTDALAPRRNSRRKVADLLEDVAWLAATGMSLHGIADQLGLSVEGIKTAYRRAGAGLPLCLRDGAGPPATTGEEVA